MQGTTVPSFSCGLQTSFECFLMRQASTEYLSVLAKFFRFLSAQSDGINILPLDYVQTVKEYIAKILFYFGHYIQSQKNIFECIDTKAKNIANQRL